MWAAAAAVQASSHGPILRVGTLFFLPEALLERGPGDILGRLVGEHAAGSGVCVTTGDGSCGLPNLGGMGDSTALWRVVSSAALACLSS